MSEMIAALDPETHGHADTEPSYSELLNVTPSGSESTYA